MATCGTNGSGTAAGEQRFARVGYDALYLKRALKTYPDGPEAGQTDPGRAEIDVRYARQLDTIIDLLRALLATLSSNVPPDTEKNESLPPCPDEGYVRERYRLTPRESEVLAQIVLGKSNRQIALALAVGVATIRSHVSNILAKMGAESRTEAAVMALLHLERPENGQSTDRSRDIPSRRLF